MSLILLEVEGGKLHNLYPKLQESCEPIATNLPELARFAGLARR
jgi:hypothetical protein